VTTGVFRISRNRMYRGLVLLVIGVAILMNRAIPLLVPPAFASTASHTFHSAEERRMAKAFGTGLRAWRVVRAALED
jgi:protein-S-isoprenylcysteine O-methyltransferase Ste14